MTAVYDSPPLSRTLDACADAVAAVMAGQSLGDALERVPAAVRPAAQALSFHCLRRLGGAGAVRTLLAPRTPPPRVESLLTCALALLWPAATPPYPDHTLVDQAVECARQRTPAAAGFVNAVLRRFVRERAALVAAAERAPEAAWNHPAWWIDRVRRDWPAQWQPLLLSALQHPPMTLRVNARRSTAAAYVQRLVAQGMAASVLSEPSLGGQAVQLARPVPVERLPGFAEGDVSVQDAAAQRAAPLLLYADPAAPVAERRLAVPAGARVLDACAAPGGKTAQLLELAELDLLALDSDPRRLDKVGATLRRLGLSAEVRAGDARRPESWWDGRPFDAILLDAPCSASGIVRRHPDIRWLRRPEDVISLAAVQDALLDALWPLLKPGGRLVYATCSLFRAEGQERIDAFLQRRGPEGASLDPTSPGHLLPLPDNLSADAPAPADGFHLALLRKP